MNGARPFQTFWTALLLGLLPIVVSVSPVRSETSPTAEFDLAENSFDFQDYARAADLFRELLYPTVRLVDPAQVRIARERLGASYWFLEETQKSDEEFSGLLAKSPEHALDPFFYPPELIQFYNAVLSRLQRLGIIEAPEEPPEEAVPTEKIQREIIENTPFVTAFVPFGIGQFLNGDNVSGTAFLATETLALASTITSYYLLIDTAPIDPELAGQYETAFWVSQGVFWGLAITGIVDAVIHHVGQRVSRETLEIPIIPPSNSPSKQSSLTPTLGFTPQNGVFVGFSGHLGHD